MLPDDDDESEATPAATPDAKKSSGAWKFKFNSDDAVCGRSHPRCVHRRDEHESTASGGAGRCMLCNCDHFVVGGMTTEEQRADTDKGFPAVKKPEGES